jgi:putative Mg2+ transporter-C (MgtC) family protein
MNNLLTLEDSLPKILLAVILGALIGAEREYKSKNAGFRTIILVTLGATLFTMVSELVTKGKDYHVIGNIVVGIGFLGAGAIFKEGNNTSGLTTAVTIWISAAIGMAIGTGEFIIAIVMSIVVLMILIGFSSIQLLIESKNKEKYYKICIKNNHALNEPINALIKEAGLNAIYANTSGKDKELTFTVKLKGSDKKHGDFLLLLANSPEIISFES